MIFRLAMKGESDKVLHVPCERIFMDRSRARVLRVDHQPWVKAEVGKWTSPIYFGLVFYQPSLVHTGCGLKRVKTLKNAKKN